MRSFWSVGTLVIPDASELQLRVTRFVVFTRKYVNERQVQRPRTTLRPKCYIHGLYGQKIKAQKICAPEDQRSLHTFTHLLIIVVSGRQG